MASRRGRAAAGAAPQGRAAMGRLSSRTGHACASAVANPAGRRRPDRGQHACDTGPLSTGEADRSPRPARARSIASCSSEPLRNVASTDCHSRFAVAAGVDADEPLPSRDRRGGVAVANALETAVALGLERSRRGRVRRLAASAGSIRTKRESCFSRAATASSSAPRAARRLTPRPAALIRERRIVNAVRHRRLRRARARGARPAPVSLRAAKTSSALGTRPSIASFMTSFAVLFAEAGCLPARRVETTRRPDALPPLLAAGSLGRLAGAVDALERMKTPRRRRRRKPPSFRSGAALVSVHGRDVIGERVADSLVAVARATSRRARVGRRTTPPAAMPCSDRVSARGGRTRVLFVGVSASSRACAGCRRHDSPRLEDDGRIVCSGMPVFTPVGEDARDLAAVRREACFLLDDRRPTSALRRRS